jgi:hypothetical protein
MDSANRPLRTLLPPIIQHAMAGDDQMVMAGLWAKWKAVAKRPPQLAASFSVTYDSSNKTGGIRAARFRN